MRYYFVCMIKTFRDKETEALFHGMEARKLPRILYRSAMRKLTMLDAAVSMQDLRVPPGNRLEKLSGDRKGQWSIRINLQWRICFSWIDQNAYDVEIIDYHQ